MGRECDYSFADLFRMVHDRSWTADEQRAFEALTQPQRNQWVREMAAKSGGSIVIEDRRGSDGEIYTAFWPR
jgi:hypothetical protein